MQMIQLCKTVSLHTLVNLAPLLTSVVSSEDLLMWDILVRPSTHTPPLRGIKLLLLNPPLVPAILASVILPRLA